MSRLLTVLIKLVMGLIWITALVFASVAVVLAIPFLLLVCAYLWVHRTRATSNFDGI